MPKKLKVSPNERIDIPDFVRGANDYTAEVAASQIQKVVLGDRGHVLEGFRIQIVNDVGNPAKVIVYNGNAFDTEGKRLHNEADPAYAQEITLTGASTEFFLEVVFEENDSDEDSRTFWDPTIANVAPIPNGREFDTSVVTRITPTWRIVRPVSTTGFDFSITNPDSVKIPLVRLKTDGTNQIVPDPVDNPGLEVAFPSTVLTADALSTDSSIKVADARLFSDGVDNAITIDPDTTAAAANVAIVDRDNHILSLVGTIGADYPAGTIIRATGKTSEYVVERTSGLVPIDPSQHPDNISRIWQGNEVRGSGLAVSKESAAARDDLNIKNLKDEIDFLSAIIREMKWGSLRVGDDGIADTRIPPLGFDIATTSPRYFDKSRGIQGAGTRTITVGDGVLSYGDFNANDESGIQAAVDAASAGDTIFIKTGVYIFTAAVTVDKALTFIGDGSSTALLTISPIGALFISTIATVVRFKDLTMSALNASNTCIAFEDDALLEFTMDNCNCIGSIRTGTGGTLQLLRVANSFFANTIDNAIIIGRAGTTVVAQVAIIQNNIFITAGEDVTLVRLQSIVSLNWDNITWQSQDQTVDNNSTAISLALPTAIEYGSITKTYISSLGLVCPRLIAPENVGDGVNTLLIDGVFLVGVGTTAGILSVSKPCFIQINNFSKLDIKNVYGDDGVEASSFGPNDAMRFIEVGKGLTELEAFVSFENIVASWDTINSGVGIQVGDAVSDQAIGEISVYARNCFITSSFIGFNFSHKGSIVADNCGVDGLFSLSRSQYGFLINNSPASDFADLSVTLRDCFARNLLYSNFTEISGVKISNPRGFTDNPVYLTIDSCLFDSLGTSVAASPNTFSSGVLVNPDAHLGALIVENTTISNINSSSTGFSGGIFVYGYQYTAGFRTKISIIDNLIANIGANSNSVQGVVLATLGVASSRVVTNTTIRGNVFDTLFSNGVANFGIIVRHDTTLIGLVHSVDISDNLMSIVGSGVSTEFGAQISIESGALSNVSIENNLLSGWTGVGIQVLLNTLANGGSSRNLSVSRNHVLAGPILLRGLMLIGIPGTTPGTFSTWNRTLINGNTFEASQSTITTGDQRLIQIYGHLSDLRISDNCLVAAGAAPNAAAGLLLIDGITSGLSNRVTVTGNTGLRDYGLGANGYNIEFRDVNFFTFTGNAIDIVESEELIAFGNCEDGAISGNVFESTGIMTLLFDVTVGNECERIIGSGNNLGAGSVSVLGQSVPNSVLFEVGGIATIPGPLNMNA